MMNENYYTNEYKKILLELVTPIVRSDNSSKETKKKQIRYEIIKWYDIVRKELSYNQKDYLEFSIDNYYIAQAELANMFKEFKRNELDDWINITEEQKLNIDSMKTWEMLSEDIFQRELCR